MSFALTIHIRHNFLIFPKDFCKFFAAIMSCLVFLITLRFSLVFIDVNEFSLGTHSVTQTLIVQLLVLILVMSSGLCLE